ncbi:MAG: ATP-binding protein [bacterium]|nr:ATP-binding protein [bacterium]
MHDDHIRHSLGERVKELTALHRTARCLQDAERPLDDLMAEVLAILPEAWQYPTITAARLRTLGREWATTGFRDTPWLQRAAFTARDARDGGEIAGMLEVCYLEPRPAADEGPFLREERDLIDSLADMLRLHVQHELADEALRDARDGLERQVHERTAQLEASNAALKAEIEEHRRARREIELHQRQLRRLASELSLAEARERRAIAADLHDHLGQALAFVKLRLGEFAGDAVFCGFEQSLQELETLIDQAIRYTRTLTCELSPPVLHELGLGPALEWLGEQAQARHRIRVDVRVARDAQAPGTDLAVMLFQCARELVANAVRHGRPRRVRIDLRREGDDLRLEVSDDGAGCDPARLVEAVPADGPGGFGLFSIRERLRHLGGGLEAESAPGRGATIVLRAPLTPTEVRP